MADKPPTVRRLVQHSGQRCCFVLLRTGHWSVPEGGMENTDKFRIMICCRTSEIGGNSGNPHQRTGGNGSATVRRPGKRDEHWEYLYDCWRRTDRTVVQRLAPSLNRKIRTLVGRDHFAAFTRPPLGCLQLFARYLMMIAISAAE
jgi:hypothetical protein